MTLGRLLLVTYSFLRRNKQAACAVHMSDQAKGLDQKGGEHMRINQRRDYLDEVLEGTAPDLSELPRELQSSLNKLLMIQSDAAQRYGFVKKQIKELAEEFNFDPKTFKPKRRASSKGD